MSIVVKNSHPVRNSIVSCLNVGSTIVDISFAHINHQLMETKMGFVLCPILIKFQQAHTVNGLPMLLAATVKLLLNFSKNTTLMKAFLKKKQYD